MDLQSSSYTAMLRGCPIPMADLNSAIAELNSQSAQWYRANYGEACRIAVESEASRQFLITMLNASARMQGTGQDFSVPLVILAATMLQIGYTIGRKRAEAEILEGWMRL
jgi:hypothetical protein